MKGYIDYSRSVRAQEAMEDYCFPISLFTRENINNFIDFFEVFNEIPEIRKVSIKKWKFIAINKIGSCAWHHTSKMFNKTEFYSLADVCDYIEKNWEEVQNLNLKPSKKLDFEYAYCKMPNWSGTLHHPKLDGFNFKEGVIIGEWFYYCVIYKEKIYLHKKKISARLFSILSCSSDFNAYKKELKLHKVKSLGKRILDKIVKAKLAKKK